MNELNLMRPELWRIPTPDAAALARLPEITQALHERLRDITARFGRVRLASSLAVEDMVITDQIAQFFPQISVFMLNTGRLNAETLALKEAMRARYPALVFEEIHPDEAAVAQYVREHGLNAFYESLALRKTCCHLRKVEPLNRALMGANAWLTGQRREQAATRGELDFEENDAARGIAKFNPIFDWGETDVWAYVLTRNLPYNTLYEQGYPSIGCEPCTRPVRAGEDIRAGRWWWESRDSKECGLHTSQAA